MLLVKTTFLMDERKNLQCRLLICSPVQAGCVSLLDEELQLWRDRVTQGEKVPWWVVSKTLKHVVNLLCFIHNFSSTYSLWPLWCWSPLWKVSWKGWRLPVGGEGQFVLGLVGKSKEITVINVIISKIFNSYHVTANYVSVSLSVGMT